MRTARTKENIEVVRQSLEETDSRVRGEAVLD